MPSVDVYNLARGLHVIVVIAWMAGLLMLPRLYAYQTESQPSGELEAKMIVATRLLRKIILTPTLILSWGIGLFLLLQYHLASGMPVWLWLKLALVAAITGLHGFYVMQGRKLARGERPLSSKAWRMLNEVPFLLAIPVVLLGTIEPW